jgi:hypothetical protein
MVSGPCGAAAQDHALLSLDRLRVLRAVSAHGSVRDAAHVLRAAAPAP